MLSDRLSSEFETPGDRNAIETCLANVRKASVYICIVSERYGATLSAPYCDVSATHLEYRTARDADKPVHFYVRDSVVGAYEGHSSGLDVGLRSFLDERQADARSNWRWPFSNSVDLKDRIAFDLKTQSRRILLRRMIEQGQAPVLNLSSAGLVASMTKHILRLRIQNVGAMPAFAVRLRDPKGGWHTVGDLLSSRDPGVCELAMGHMIRPENFPFAVQYATVLGDLLEDGWEYEYESMSKASLRRRTRTIVEGRYFEIV